MVETIEKGSGNVFADLGFPDPDAHKAKADLVRRISAEIKLLGLTQAEAAKRMAMRQPDVSKMLNGQFRPLSLERLLACLRKLGHDIEIDVVKPSPSVEVTKAGRLLVRGPKSVRVIGSRKRKIKHKAGAKPATSRRASA